MKRLGRRIYCRSSVPPLASCWVDCPNKPCIVELWEDDMDAFAACPLLGAVGLFASMWGAGILADDASAQPYPNRPIRCIVVYVAGSSPDAAARIGLSSEALRAAWSARGHRQRGGVYRIIGTETAARSVPDGYTIFLGGDRVSDQPLLLQALGPGREELLADHTDRRSPLPALVGHPAPCPWTGRWPNSSRSAKARPGELTYGSAGKGFTWSPCG